MALGLATVAGAVVVLWTDMSPVICGENDNSQATLALSWMIMENCPHVDNFFLFFSSREYAHAGLLTYCL